MKKINAVDHWHEGRVGEDTDTGCGGIMAVKMAVNASQKAFTPMNKNERFLQLKIFSMPFVPVSKVFVGVLANSISPENTGLGNME